MCLMSDLPRVVALSASVASTLPVPYSSRVIRYTETEPGNHSRFDTKAVREPRIYAQDATAFTALQIRASLVA